MEPNDKGYIKKSSATHMAQGILWKRGGKNVRARESGGSL